MESAQQLIEIDLPEYRLTPENFANYTHEPPLDLSRLLQTSLAPQPKGPRNLREVIPPGKGRFSKGDKGTQEYLDRIRSGQTCGIQSALKLIHTERSRDWQNPSTVCIVGGGPSLQDEVSALRRLINKGAKVLAVNKSHDWLLERGLPCHYAALLDPKDWVAGYINLNLAASKSVRRRCGKRWLDPKYLIASQCHGATIAKFKGRDDSYIWHAAAGLGELDVLRNEFPKELWMSIAGASVIGLRAVALAHGLGFRKMHFFGIDGSMKPPKRPGDKPQLYSYAKPHIDPTWKHFEVKLNSGWNRPFMSNHHMARSVYEFEDSMRDWDEQIREEKMEPFNILVHGNPEYSAIAMVAAGMGVHADPEQNAKYGKAP